MSQSKCHMNFLFFEIFLAIFQVLRAMNHGRPYPIDHLAQMVDEECKQLLGYDANSDSSPIIPYDEVLNLISDRINQLPCGFNRFYCQEGREQIANQVAEMQISVEFLMDQFRLCLKILLSEMSIEIRDLKFSREGKSNSQLLKFKGHRNFAYSDSEKHFFGFLNQCYGSAAPHKQGSYETENEMAAEEKNTIPIQYPKGPLFIKEQTFPSLMGAVSNYIKELRSINYYDELTKRHQAVPIVQRLRETLVCLESAIRLISSSVHISTPYNAHFSNLQAFVLNQFVPLSDYLNGPNWSIVERFDNISCLLDTLLVHAHVITHQISESVANAARSQLRGSSRESEPRGIIPLEKRQQPGRINSAHKSPTRISRPSHLPIKGTKDPIDPHKPPQKRAHHDPINQSAAAQSKHDSDEEGDVPEQQQQLPGAQNDSNGVPKSPTSTPEKVRDKSEPRLSPSRQPEELDGMEIKESKPGQSSPRHSVLRQHSTEEGLDESNALNDITESLGKLILDYCSREILPPDNDTPGGSGEFNSREFQSTLSDFETDITELQKCYQSITTLPPPTEPSTPSYPVLFYELLPRQQTLIEELIHAVKEFFPPDEDSKCFFQKYAELAETIHQNFDTGSSTGVEISAQGSAYIEAILRTTRALNLVVHQLIILRKAQNSGSMNAASLQEMSIPSREEMEGHSYESTSQHNSRLPSPDHPLSPTLNGQSSPDTSFSKTKTVIPLSTLPSESPQNRFSPSPQHEQGEVRNSFSTVLPLATSDSLSQHSTPSSRGSSPRSLRSPSREQMAYDPEVHGYNSSSMPRASTPSSPRSSPGLTGPSPPGSPPRMSRAGSNSSSMPRASTPSSPRSSPGLTGPSPPGSPSRMSRAGSRSSLGDTN